MAYELIEHKNYYILKLTSDLDKESAQEFKAEIESLKEPEFPFIVNALNVESVNQTWIRELLLFSKNLKANGTSLHIIYTGHNLRDIIRENALQDLFVEAKDLRDAKKKAGILGGASLDVNFINPFVKATLKVLKIQAFTEAKATKPYIKKDPKEKMLGDISGIIGVVSNSFNGNIVLSYPEETFLKVMSKMLGEEYTEMDQDIIDGAGELMNIIFGQAKIELNELGYAIQTAIPNVITGKNHQIVTGDAAALIVVLPFESDCGRFNLEICIMD